MSKDEAGAQHSIIHHHSYDEEDAHHNHHVHFPESVGLNTEIQVTKKGKSVDVHLGFLQYKHKYQMNFVVPVAENETVSHSTTSLFICICNVKKLDDGRGQEVVLQLDAHKEGLLQDKFELKSDSKQDVYQICIKARVLGPKKGTPMLKENITCIAMEKDEDHDDSDWQGFD